VSIQRINIIGSGWLAQPLARHLIHDKYQVSLTSREADKCQQLCQAGLDTFQFDITNESANYSQVLACDVLIIAITSKSVEAYTRLAKAITHTNIEHVLYISSTSVYQSTNEVVTEDAGLENPDSLIYQIEQALCMIINTPLTRLRFSGLIGPKRHPGRFFRGGKTIKSPDAPVNLIHQTDCIGLIQTILNQPEQWGQAYNGCASTHPIKRDFYPHVFQQVGNEVPPFDTGETHAYKIVSNTKSKQVLNYTYKHDDLMALQPQDYN
jgi:nucleoside-diphosphate-sugar epimerase